MGVFFKWPLGRLERRVGDVGEEGVWFWLEDCDFEGDDGLEALRKRSSSNRDVNPFGLEGVCRQVGDTTRGCGDSLDCLGVCETDDALGVLYAFWGVALFEELVDERWRLWS